MNRKLLFLLLASLLIMALACSDGGAESDDDDDASADDDDNADDDDATDDDSGTPDDDDTTDSFEMDGVTITGKTTDAQGYVTFTVDGGTVSFYALDEEQQDETLAGIKVYLIIKELKAAVLVLDDGGNYLPFLADVTTLQTPSGKSDAKVDLVYLLSLARSFNASANEPLIVGAQIDPDLLRVMLVFFFEASGSQALSNIAASLDGIADLVDPTKVIQFALFADADTATEPVPVVLAVYDGSDANFSNFFLNIFLSRCFDETDTFDLYTHNEPLTDNAPAGYLFALASPNFAPGASQSYDLSVTIKNAVNGATVPAAKVIVSPPGYVDYGDANGQTTFSDLQICDGATSTLLYVRISRFGFYPAQFTVSEIVPGQVNAVTFSLSPMTSGSDTPTWLAIPGGSFNMGCSSGDEYCDADEYPVHAVNISAFQMTETEITQMQYETEMGYNPAWYYDCPNCPVEFLTWAEASSFCEAIGGSLPTEAQWEYAARASSTTRYYCGDGGECLDGISWNKYNAGSRTHPAKQKTPNAFNLYDMTGNVWEFTADFYAADYYGVSPAQDPTGPANGQYRVMRGGSWYSGYENNRTSNRFEGDTVGRYANFGFRCVK